MQHPFRTLAGEYASLWDRMVIRPDRRPEIDRAVQVAMNALPRYATVASQTGVPAIVIAAIHMRESSFNFRTHLHNGDPLSARTVHVPPGRPLVGSPPFSWEASAIDALAIDHLNTVSNWTVERAAYQFEVYNGFGPRAHGIETGYLWAGSNHYVRGKYVEDGKWSGSFVDQQLGTMVLLRAMIDRNPDLRLPREQTPANVSSTTQAPPVGLGDHGGHDTKWLQASLNKIGAQPPLDVDGSYGRETMRAVCAYQGAHGLQVDGIAGPETSRSIERALLATQELAQPVSAPASTGQPPDAKPAPTGLLGALASLLAALFGKGGK